MLLKQIHDPYLSQYAYLVGCPDSGEALIIDAERDVDRYVELAADNNLELKYATETHIHADFLGGIRQLIERNDGVSGYLSKMGGDDWQYKWAQDHEKVTLLNDGDSFTVGNIEVSAIHLPGHTPEHLCFLIEDHGAGADRPFAFVSGDFMFVGDVGRPDLLESAAGEEGSREASAEDLFHSIEKFSALEGFITLLPGHGAGSSCGKALGAIPFSTTGYELRFNKTVQTALVDGKEAFVEEILTGQPAPPMYFARMKNVNREGVPLYDQLPKPEPLKVESISRIYSEDPKEFVFLDVRKDREDFMNRHLQGSLHAPYGPKFSEAAGSYVTPETKIYLLVEDPDQVESCVRQLMRIGLDRIEGFVVAEEILPDPVCNPFIAQIKTIQTKDIQPDSMTVVDVRSPEEYADGHAPQAINVPHTRLLADSDELPEPQPVTVHCGSGMRAALASAELARSGFDVTFANGFFSDWVEEAEEVVKGT